MTQSQRLRLERRLERLSYDAAKLVDELQLFSETHDLACRASDIWSEIYELQRTVNAGGLTRLRTRSWNDAPA